MSLPFRPTNNRILVEPIHGAPQRGAIHLPEAHRESRPAEAMVVALGPRNELPIRVGDRVLTERYNGNEVHIGGKAYRLLEPVDVIALVTDAPDN
jgi:chaperonin GroES